MVQFFPFVIYVDPKDTLYGPPVKNQCARSLHLTEKVQFTFTKKLLPTLLVQTTRSYAPTFTKHTLCHMPKKQNKSACTKDTHKMLVKLDPQGEEEEEERGPQREVVKKIWSPKAEESFHGFIQFTFFPLHNTTNLMLAMRRRRRERRLLRTTHTKNGIFLLIDT